VTRRELKLGWAAIAAVLANTIRDSDRWRLLARRCSSMRVVKDRWREKGRSLSQLGEIIHWSNSPESPEMLGKGEPQ